MFTAESWMAVLRVRLRIELGEEERKSDLNSDVDDGEGLCWDTSCFCEAAVGKTVRAIWSSRCRYSSSGL